VSRAPRIAVIQPRLDGHGGLEKYGVFVIETLCRHWPVDVITEHVVDLERVERAFGVRLDRANFICDPRCSPQPTLSGGVGGRLQRWRSARDFHALTARYDLIIGQTIGLPYRSGAATSIMLCHFPVVRSDKVDTSLTGSWRLLLSSTGREQRAIRARLASWDRIICNSQFTQRWIRCYWAREATIVNPPIEKPDSPDLSAKRAWIVGVGFFGRPAGGPEEPWSYKRQELLIDTFKALCDSGLHGWELHLAGHVLPPTPEVHAYVGELRARADNYPVFLHPNCSHEELLGLYRQSSIFWHATGYGVNDEQSPEKMEHFGMSTAEAMGWGCVPVVINKGGQQEIVEHGKNGYLWDTLEQLRDTTAAVAQDHAALQDLRLAAVERAQYFGLERFRSQITELVRNELGTLKGLQR